MIGHWLVDRGVSLRPEERRALFEEAAGINRLPGQASGGDRPAGRRRRRTSARQRHHQRNPTAAETPCRQAEQARNYHASIRNLRELLFEWYGFRWHQRNGLSPTPSPVLGHRRGTSRSGAPTWRDWARPSPRTVHGSRNCVWEWASGTDESSAVHAKSETNRAIWLIRQERRRHMETSVKRSRGDHPAAHEPRRAGRTP